MEQPLLSFSSSQPVYLDVVEKDPNYQPKKRISPSVLLAIALFAFVAAVGILSRRGQHYAHDGTVAFCRPGWIFYEATNRCYKVVERAVSWSDAQRDCANDEADLVTIHSKQESDFVAALTPQHAWIGLRKHNAEADYDWVDGTEVDFENWAKDKPYQRVGWAEFCVETGSPRSQVPKFRNRWSNVECGSEFIGAFICARSTEAGASMKTAAPRLCPDGYSLLASSVACFKASTTETKTWRDAESACARDGGHLASFHSAAENDFVTSLTSRSVYIGLHLGLQNAWTWSDDSEVDFENYAVGSPTDTEERHNCILVEGSSRRSIAATKWRNVACNLAEAFVCRQPARYIPPSQETEEEPEERNESEPLRRVHRPEVEEHQYGGDETEERPTNPLPQPIPQTVTCPDGFTLFQGSCYKISSTETGGLDTDKECAKTPGAFLVSIHTQEENDFVAALSPNGMYIGLFSTTHDNRNFAWSDNSTLDFQSWVSDPAEGEDDAEHDCVAIFGQNALALAGKWQPQPCLTLYKFVCKITPGGQQGSSARSLTPTAQPLIDRTMEIHID